MKPELKGMWIDSSEYILENFQPKNDDDFFLLVNLKIGPNSEVGADYFQFQVCTPEWLCKNQWSPEWMRHTLLVRKYNYDEIINEVKQIIEKCNGKDWTEVSLKLSRHFDWEYEDYQV